MIDRKWFPFYSLRFIIVVVHIIQNHIKGEYDDEA